MMIPKILFSKLFIVFNIAYYVCVSILYILCIHKLFSTITTNHRLVVDSTGLNGTVVYWFVLSSHCHAPILPPNYLIHHVAQNTEPSSSVASGTTSFSVLTPDTQLLNRHVTAAGSCVKTLSRTSNTTLPAANCE